MTHNDHTAPATTHALTTIILPDEAEGSILVVVGS